MFEALTDEIIDLPERPYLAPWYQLAKEDERMLFKSGDSMVVFEGKAVQTLLPALLPLLDGTRTLDEIHECIGEAVAPATAKALKLLQEKRLLTEGPPLSDIPNPTLRTVSFLQSLGQERGITAKNVLKSLEEAEVGIVGTGIIAEEITRLLKFSGVESVRRIEWPIKGQSYQGVDLVIVAPQGKDLHLLNEWNKLALDTHTPWMQVIPYDGRFGAVGPHYIPQETSCHKCYNLRLAANVDYREELSAWNQAIEERRVLPPEYAVPPQIDLIVACVASFHVLSWRATGQTGLLNRFYAVELGHQGLSLTQHHIYRVPRCPECSRLARQGSPLPWYQE